MDADMDLAVFIDDTLREYGRSAEFRAALHSEGPGAVGGVATICPPDHRHAETPTCYQHGCRCAGCRAAESRRQKRYRLRRARAEWSRGLGKTA